MLKNMSLERAGVYSCIAIQEHKTLKNEIRKEIQVRVECECHQKLLIVENYSSR